MIIFPSPEMLKDPVDLNNLINKEVFLGDLRNMNLGMTEQEFLIRENIVKNNKINLHSKKDELENFRSNSGNVDLKDAAINTISETLSDLLIKMHFARYDEVYGTDRILGAVKPYYHYKNKTNDVTAGKALGYIDEVHATAEYLYKYHLGLFEGQEKMISCLNKKINDLNRSSFSETDQGSERQVEEIGIDGIRC